MLSRKLLGRSQQRWASPAKALTASSSSFSRMISTPSSASLSSSSLFLHPTRIALSGCPFGSGKGASATQPPNGGTDYTAFQTALRDSIKETPAATDPAKSARILRNLVKSKILNITDMRDEPAKFFLAHRVLSAFGTQGFGIRFTVQYNLFGGSFVGLAGPDQLKLLDDYQQAGRLGCFLLTETQAGVLSGLIVETTVTYNPATKSFVLHTPSDKASKNWISQGYTAEYGVVIADLRLPAAANKDSDETSKKRKRKPRKIINDSSTFNQDYVSYGPHPFLVQLRELDKISGDNLCRGITIKDMGTKTIANDLDNARVWFNQVELPQNALLNRFADVDHAAGGQYIQVTKEKMRIEVIGQRLLTGRLCIAQAAIISAIVLHLKTEQYARTKVCNGLAGETTLSKMPQLASVLKRSYLELHAMMRFCAHVEDKLSACLKSETIPDDDLVSAIAVCKIKCIEVAIETCHRLRLEVGSYALMHGSGFEAVDMLLCCKFAEGDSRILQQKLTRDRLRDLAKNTPGRGMTPTLLAAANPFGSSNRRKEASSVLRLARLLQPAMKSGNRKELQQTMDAHWKDIYGLAELLCDKHMQDAGIDLAAAGRDDDDSGKSIDHMNMEAEFKHFIGGPVTSEHYTSSSPEFNHQWKEDL